MNKKIVYVDMDNVLVDFKSALDKTDEKILKEYKDREDEIPGIFSKMDPMPGAVEAFEFLADHFDTYILSTAPWENPSAWSDKLKWVKKHLADKAYKRLIITHHKNLNKGDYLIDDRTKRGADKFEGEHIHSGQKNFETWDKVLDYICKKENIRRNAK